MEKKKKKYKKKVDTEINRGARKLHGYPGSKKHNKKSPIKRKKSWCGHPGSKKSAKEKYLFK